MNRRRMKIPEPYRGAYKVACKAKWAITRTGGNHLKWTSPEGQFVITPATPSGGNHSNRNSLARLRAAGLKC